MDELQNIQSHQKKTIFRVIRDDFFQDISHANPNNPNINNNNEVINDGQNNMNNEQNFQSPNITLSKKDNNSIKQSQPRQKVNNISRSPKKKEVTYLNKEYLLYLKSPYLIVSSGPRKDFEDYCQSFPEWENYEHILILAVSDLNDNFDKFTDYINLYLYENLKKLSDPKKIKEILLKTAKQDNDSYIRQECFNFYKYKQKELKRIVGKEININDYFELLIVTSLTYQKIKGIEELDLTQYCINGNYIQPVISAIKFNEHIQRLLLGNNPIGEEGCYWLGTMLRNNKHVIELDISSCKLTNNCIKMINEGLKIQKGVNNVFYLKKINLSSNEINEKGGIEVASLLENFTYLNWLNICKNKLKNGGFKVLMMKYQELINIQRTNLETLIVYNNDIKEEDSLEVLGKVVENQKCTLKCLVLSENDLSSSGHTKGYLSYFLDSLKKNNSIVEMLMLNCKIKNENVEDICEMLIHNKKLEKLCLYNNMIDSPCQFLKILSIFCGNNPLNHTLKELDLSKNKCKLSINDEFLTIIKTLQIESLDISQNFELSNNSDAEKFKQVALDVQSKIKIIY